MYKVQDEQYKYLEQWERVKRWYKRIEKIKRSCPKGYTDDDCLDEVYAFFMNCYHLKDWLKNSVFKDNKGSVEELESLFDKKRGKRNKFFKVCADFVNGIKHVKADKYTRIDANTRIDKQIGSRTIRKSLAYVLTTEKPNKQRKINITLPIISQYKWEIKADKKYYDVYELAERCFNEWKNFLKKKGLLKKE